MLITVFCTAMLLLLLLLLMCSCFDQLVIVKNIGLEFAHGKIIEFDIDAHSIRFGQYISHGIAETKK